ncbi:AraC family transcriptional regulator [Amycolatopsis sp. FDAARGOS 1241]|uniref:AraC family transcriptional regulator n=1 Tax=Amycolatopsis sp. FDAARGOS 1241 TaxID=2778070 RepID=UPI00194E9DF3|nr:AraC family transcriptional regulator [Amycolatopsis sp. FDAARGOS 1241]QRP47818.1 AraC family transcriptional regulator [Amycolatopsis sp. FDAARGOS 1241]
MCAGHRAAGAGPSGTPKAFCTTDLAFAREELSRVYYPLRVEPTHRTRDFDFTMRTLTVGPLTIGRLSYGAEIVKDCGDLQTAYHVNVPLAGAVASTCGDQRVLATPHTAAVFNPVGRTVLDRWEAGSEQLCLKIDRSFVEGEIVRRLERPLHAPVRFRMAMDLTQPAARAWLHAVEVLAAELDAPGAFTRDGLLAAELRGLIVGGLLWGQPHSYREALSEPGASPRPRTVKRVVDLMHASPEEPWTIARLAEQAGISVRSLEEGFRRYVGTPPMAYLRDCRLERVRADLRAGSRPAVSVGEVAFRWGFGHLGRFAQAYRAKFGENPSDTLRFGER